MMRKCEDINGVPIAIGDTVRLVRLMNDIVPPGKRTHMARHRVLAIGGGELFSGYILAEGLVGWYLASTFEKVG